MSPANASSLARSALKIGGGIGLAAGTAVAAESGALFVALFCIVGTAAVMAGLGWSYWEHTPDGGPEVVLRNLHPASIDADVAARMAEKPLPK